MLYCPKNPNLSCQNCVTVPKKPKNPMFCELWRSGLRSGLDPELHSSQNIGFLGFFGTVTQFWQERLVFLGQYSIFACPDKQTAISQSSQPAMGRLQERGRLQDRGNYNRGGLDAQKSYFYSGEVEPLRETTRNVVRP